MEKPIGFFSPPKELKEAMPNTKNPKKNKHRSQHSTAQHSSIGVKVLLYESAAQFQKTTCPLSSNSLFFVLHRSWFVPIAMLVGSFPGIESIVIHTSYVSYSIVVHRDSRINISEAAAAAVRSCIPGVDTVAAAAAVVVAAVAAASAVVVVAAEAVQRTEPTRSSGNSPCFGCWGWPERPPGVDQTQEPPQR